MPFINGKRVTLDEWRAAHPTPPLYLGYDGSDDEFSTRRRVYPGDRPEIEPVADIVRRITGDTELRTEVVREVIADAMGLDPDDPEITKILAAEDQQSERLRNDDATGEGYSSEPIPAPALEGHRARSEVAATQFSRAKGLPKHRTTRHSQTPEGRRERYIRQKAGRLGVTYAVAERSTRRNQRPTSRTTS